MSDGASLPSPPAPERRVLFSRSPPEGRDWEAAVREHVLTPLGGLAGARMARVCYEPVFGDDEYLDLDPPNTTGVVMAVALDLGAERLYVGWSSRVDEFRADVFDGHLWLEPMPLPDPPDLAPPGGGRLRDAS